MARRALELEGRLYSLALAVIVMFVLDLRAREVGLTLAQRNPGVCLLAVLGLIALSAGLGFVFRPGVPDKVPWVVVLIAAIPFGVWHGWGYSDAGLSFDPMSALFPFIGGIAYGWLRFKSGSLLLPVVAHGLGNCAFYLSSLVYQHGPPHRAIPTAGSLRCQPLRRRVAPWLSPRITKQRLFGGLGRPCSRLGHPASRRPVHRFQEFPT